MSGENEMLSPLKPLLCRHEFYWSERHRADRCRRCGKTQAASPQESSSLVNGATPSLSVDEVLKSFASEGPQGAMDSAFFDIPTPEQPAPTAARSRSKGPSAKVLKAQASERRENLLALLDRIAVGGQPSRQDSLDALLAVIEDAHSSDPVLFGPNAAGHFARLHEARGGLIF
jgi:hypothetical protein